ncbi:MAG: ABC transporter ATP-binding protein [Cyclobacteriaceae bacterium]|nr:ABC transporter ATP-binding protein [Cyclobacteriaceae bacterium SS2]
MIEINQLSYGYKRKHEALKSMDLSVGPGNICGLLGLNGAGKSTILKAIAGLVTPHSGEIKTLGYQPDRRDPAFLREVVIITEEFTLPGFSIGKYLELYSPFYPRFNHAAFQRYLEEFQLTNDQKLTGLSYGQKKKFLLSFGLATDCKLVLLDEPTNGLDIPSKSQFRKVVANAVHEERTLIISTHQIRDMENLIDPIIILDQGKIIFHENMESISQKLAIRRMNDLPKEGVIYHETYLGGYTILTENQSSEHTHMNLEILFNAVVGQKEKIQTVFNQKVNA